MLFRSSALALIALAASTNAFVSTPNPAFTASSALAMSEMAASEAETAFDKSLKADIRKEVRLLDNYYHLPHWLNPQIYTVIVFYVLLTRLILPSPHFS